MDTGLTKNMTATNFHIDPAYRAAIMEELRGIEERESVKILFAIESGSRAWGFPSPDSDYDARFIYARHPDWYLSLTPGRDVIELPIDDLLDINGWDIQKALGLLLKPNPVMLEWLSSPIRYMWQDELCGKLIDFSREVSHAAACIYHYRSLAAKQWEQQVEGNDEIKLKKYLYILRPAMVLRWIRHHPEIIPPMNFQALMDGANVPEDICAQLDDLLARKSKAKETGLSPRWPDLDAFIQAELKWASGYASDFKSDSKGKMPEANALFREIIKTAWP